VTAQQEDRGVAGEQDAGGTSRPGPVLAVARLGRLLPATASATLPQVRLGDPDGDDKITCHAVIVTVGTFAALVANIAFGVLSDRTGRRKVFVVAAAATVPTAGVPMALTDVTWAFRLFAVAAPAGSRLLSAVDRAVLAVVPPTRENRGRDLGFSNIASTMTALPAPMIASAVVLPWSRPVLFAIAVSCTGGMPVLPVRRPA
jgi:MFS family permease